MLLPLCSRISGSYYPNATQGPGQVPRVQSVTLFQCCPSERCLLPNPMQPVGLLHCLLVPAAKKKKKKATKLKACYLSLPEPKHSAACVTHTPRPRQTLHVSTLISLAFPSPQFLDLIPPHAGHFFHPNTSKPLDSWPVYLQV